MTLGVHVATRDDQDFRPGDDRTLKPLVGLLEQLRPRIRPRLPASQGALLRHRQVRLGVGRRRMLKGLRPETCPGDKTRENQTKQRKDFLHKKRAFPCGLSEIKS
jgi:hypothetical protein